MVTNGQALFGKTEVSCEFGAGRGEETTINKHVDKCNFDANMGHEYKVTYINMGEGLFLNIEEVRKTKRRGI